MDRVFESKNLRVLFVPGRGAARTDRIVIAFRSMLAAGHIAQKLFPDTGESQITIQKTGADALHFLPASNHWYQYPEIFDALAATKSISDRYHHVITYGMSMGGFAALQSSAFLNADITITYSPQISVDHRKYNFVNRRWQSRMSGATFLWDDLAHISTTARHIVIYDPFDPDHKHIGVLRSHVTPEVILTPFSGHHSWRAIKDAGIGSAMLTRLIRGETDHAWIRKSIRAGRRNNPVYLAKMRERLALRQGMRAQPIQT